MLQKLLLSIIGVSWFLMFCGFSVRGQNPPALVITHVTVVPLNQNIILPDQTVLIQQGHIKTIGAADRISVMKGAQVVDGKYKFLMPGLIDMHAHLPGKEGTPHNLNSYLRLNVACGVTGLRSMRGDSVQLRWRDSLRDYKAIAPRLYLGSPVLTRNKRYSSQQATALLYTYKRNGYDFIKYLGGMSASQYDSLLVDAQRLGLKVAGHAPVSGLQGALASRMASVEHIEAFVEAYDRDSVLFKQQVKQMARQGQATCPDVYWYQVAGLQYPLTYLQQLPGLQYVDERLQKQWSWWYAAKVEARSLDGTNAVQLNAVTALRSYRRALLIMHQAGVSFLISPGDGPFVVPGFGMAEEMKLLTSYGISNYAVLRAATLNAATWLGQQDRLGTVEAGKEADLVLLDANPLENVANVLRVSGTVLQGRWVPASSLLPPRR